MPGLALTLSGLSVHGEGGRCLLRIDDFAIAPGTLLGIEGPSGAGKTTFLHALAGLLPAGGLVKWGETDLLSLGARARARFRRTELGFMFQDFLLFDELSAAENAAIAAAFRPRRMRPAIKAAAGAALVSLGVPDPQRRARTFSGGERQRIGVARALAHAPRAILADEPTANLDRETAARLVDDLLGKARAAGITLIAASHDAALLSRMDRVIRLDGGALAASADRTAA